MSQVPKSLGRRFRRGPIQAVVADGYSLMELIMVIILMSVAMPGIVGMFTAVLTNSHKAEIMMVANVLAAEQMEIILADKGGSGGSGGYNSINEARYSNVNPTGYFSAYTRTVAVQTMNLGDQYEYKLITVTVSHSLIPPITLTTIVMDHSAL